MRVPGFTAEVSLHVSNRHYTSGLDASDLAPLLRPAQTDSVWDRSIDANRRSVDAINPPVCRPLPRGLYEGCLRRSFFECFEECAPGDRVCVDACHLRWARFCLRLKEICRPLPPSRTPEPTEFQESPFI
jgi:hypothetical protein